MPEGGGGGGPGRSNDWYITLWDAVLDFTKSICLEIAFCHTVSTKG